MALCCHLCGTARQQITPQPDRKDASRYHCPTCGVYELTGPAKAAWQTLSSAGKSQLRNDIQARVAEANACNQIYTIMCGDLELPPSKLSFSDE